MCEHSHRVMHTSPNRTSIVLLASHPVTGDDAAGSELLAQQMKAGGQTVERTW